MNASPVTMYGNLTDDPELRFTENGTAVCSFSVAVNHRYKDDDGDWVETLNGFFDAQCWRQMAENVAEILKKGDRVIVYGTLRQRSWEDEDGDTHWRTYVEATDVAKSLMWAHQASKKKKAGNKKGGSRRTKPRKPEGRAPEPDDEDIPF